MLVLFDWIVIALYLAVTVALGLWYGGKQDDTEDYFTGGGSMSSRFQALLVGLSIAATLFSGISFLAYPSIVYQHGLAVMVGMVSFPLCWVFMRFFLIKRYMAMSHVEPYRVVEDRFGVGVRSVTAGMFLLLRIGWMSALIYAPTVAILGAGDIHGDTWFWAIALTIGLTSTVYTTLGGIRGVIVTDALQFVVIFGALVLVVVVAYLRLPVSLAEGWATLGESGRLQILNWSLNPTRPFTVWSMVIGMTVANLAAYLADQMSLQRYLSCGDTEAAGRSFTVNILGAGAVVFMLAITGLGLCMWYAVQPDAVTPTNPDQLFPRFVAMELPVGVTGLVLAAILAATMSSMTSGINTLSATVTFDFRARFGRPMTSRQQLRYAKVTSLLVGVLATCFAGLVGKLGDIFSITQTLLGVFLGPLLGCILFTLLRVNVRPGALIVAMLLGCAAGWCVTFSDAHSLWVAPTALLVTLIVAPLLSPFFPAMLQPSQQPLNRLGQPDDRRDDSDHRKGTRKASRLK